MRFSLYYSQVVCTSTSFGWFLLVFKQFQKQPLQKSYFQSALPLNVAFRLQHSARNQFFTVFRESIPQTLLLWTQNRVDAILWTTVEFGVGWDLGLSAGGLVSRDLQPHKRDAQWVFGCSTVRQCWCTCFLGYPKLVPTWVLGQLESCPWWLPFCLYFWLNSSILFLLSTSRSLETQLPSFDFVSGGAPTSVVFRPD